MRTKKPKIRRVNVFSSPSTHWGATETTAWAQVGETSIDIIVRNPAFLSTARIDDMVCDRDQGTTIVLRLTRRQVAAWLKESAR